MYFDISEKIIPQIKQPLWESWYIKECVGTGGFSAVYRIEAQRTNRIDVSALKIEPIIGDERFMQNEERYQSFLENKRKEYENESGLMYKLRHCPNIVKYEEEDIRELTENGQLIGYYFLIRMEYLQNIYDQMLSHNFNYNENNIQKLALDIAHALEEAHNIGIIHRDVKPSNFFVSRDGVYKLGDFNIAKQAATARSFAGTEGYIAPEVYRAKINSDDSYSTQADIYSFGICLYQMLNGGLFPFEDQCLTEEAIDRRMSGEILLSPKNASIGFARIILKACAYDPNERYQTIAEMIADLKELQLTDNDNSNTDKDIPAFIDCNATVYASVDHLNNGTFTKVATKKKQ